MPWAAHHALICGLIAAKLARRSWHLGAIAVLSALGLSSKRARAQDLEPTLLVYHAPPECPPVFDFQRSVERRSSRIHFVDEGSHTRELSIFLRKDGDLTVGELRLIEANGNLRQRIVRFPSCADAVEGLALIATVSLDPQALLEDAKSVPQKSPAAPKTPTASPEATPPKPPENQPRSGATSAPGPNPPPRAPSFEVGLGAEANAFFNAFPQATFGASVFVDVGSASPHLFAPELRAEFTYLQRLGVHGVAADGEADVKLGLVSLLGCPLKLGDETLVLRPCAMLSGGTLYTHGVDTDAASTSYHPQFSWGGAVLLAVHVTEKAEIVGDAGVGVTAIRDHFGFTAPTSDMTFTTSWSTPPVYISTGLGFRVLLP